MRNRAVRLTASLLETEEPPLAKVCMYCAQGRYVPNASHGMCRRHFKEHYGKFLTPEAQAELEQRPEEDFCPDEGGPPAKASFYPSSGGPSSV